MSSNRAAEARVPGPGQGATLTTQSVPESCLGLIITTRELTTSPRDNTVTETHEEMWPGDMVTTQTEK